ncbi:MAG: heme o synthase [Candidatus Limnocylindria bacterium]
MTGFTRLAWAAVAATFVLVVVGVVVRSTGSGLGCPEWPTCHGSWVPPFNDPHAIIEWSHRTTAAIVGFLALGVAVAALIGHRGRPSVLWPSVAAFFLVVFQALLGKVTVESDLAGEIVTAHLATAMALLALVLYVALRSGYPAVLARRGSIDRFTALTGVTAGATYLLVLLGSHVTATGTALAFPDWPLMSGTLLPRLTELTAPHAVHRWAAILVGLLVAATAVAALRSRRDDRSMVSLAVGAALLYVIQAVIGGLQVFTRLAGWTQVLHLALGAAIWGLLVSLLIVSAYRPRMEARAADEHRPASPQRPSVAGQLQAYVALTKPRIIELLLVTTVPTMVLAQGGLPSVWLMLAVVIGGALAAGGANAINQFVDRDIDDVMRRTRHRPLPRRAVGPRQALIFGVTLSVVAFAWLAVMVNLLSALLASSAIVFYVFVYTIWLKRTTPQNIVIGGAAGCVPVLVAWAAVTGTVGVPALVLFAIVFYWTPPHFWALALRYRGDYAAAGVPMLPVVRGELETARQILLYSVLLVIVSLLLFPAAGMGLIYLVAAIVLGALFLLNAVRLRLALGGGPAAIRLFRYSISYLTLLFGAVALDSIFRLPLR